MKGITIKVVVNEVTKPFPYCKKIKGICVTEICRAFWMKQCGQPVFICKLSGYWTHKNLSLSPLLNLGPTHEAS